MGDTKTGMLPIPGANIHYRVRGSGPMLLMLQGGDGDAEGMDGVADYLVVDHTVLSYDRRGLSRSTLDDTEQAIRLETHTDDVHNLLTALTSEPVLVFGASLGALIGLDLVARYPNQVRALVAHEPPAPELLPDEERAQVDRSRQDVEDTYHGEGVPAAMRKFAAVAGISFDDLEPGVKLPQPTPQRAANLAYFLGHDAPAARRYRLDLDALKAAPARIVPAAGRASRDKWTYRCVRALADRLGIEMVEFPGGHNGFISHPRAFAATLRGLIDKNGSRP